MPTWVRSWVFGALAACALLFATMRTVLVFPLVVAVLVVLAIRSPERAALAGGAMVPTGLWFLYELRAAVERCAAMNGPNGSCQIYGVEEQAIAMALYVMVGIGLTLYAAMPGRIARA